MTITSRRDFRGRTATLFGVAPALALAPGGPAGGPRDLPWMMIWDDHEVDNDYADALSQDLDPSEWFLERRASAYRAYYEG